MKFFVGLNNCLFAEIDKIETKLKSSIPQKDILVPAALRVLILFGYIENGSFHLFKSKKKISNIANSLKEKEYKVEKHYLNAKEDNYRYPYLIILSDNPALNNFSSLIERAINEAELKSLNEEVKNKISEADLEKNFHDTIEDCVYRYSIGEELKKTKIEHSSLLKEKEELDQKEFLSYKPYMDEFSQIENEEELKAVWSSLKNARKEEFFLSMKTNHILKEYILPLLKKNLVLKEYLLPFLRAREIFEPQQLASLLEESEERSEKRMRR